MIDQVQEVKDRTDIVEIISTYLTLKKAGANYKANCPFHSEKSPSFMVSPERQTFKCFGCSEGGDVFTFIEKMEGLDFYNALKLLAEKAGVELKTQSIRYGEKDHSADQKTKLFEINEWAKKVYHKILLDHPKAEKAREYLKKRGLDQKTIEAFEIGYAPNSWDFILRFLRSKKYLDREIIDSGMAIRGERGKIFDRFRGRIMFPINNAMGTTVAFTSRIIEDDGKSAKYINSAESPIYIKGKTIYGLDKAKVAIKDAGVAVMVEGNMDVVACHQAGFHNVVAVSGTALTLDQLKILSRYAPSIAFCFDSDNAGQVAMKRAIRLALENDISVKIITMAPFKDPDEAIKADPDNWEKAVSNAKPALEYWIDGLIGSKGEISIDQKKAAAKEILPVIKVIYSDIEKEHYIRYLSQKLDVSEKSLVDALEKTKKDREFAGRKDDEAAAEAPKLSAFERILGLVWAEPDLAKDAKAGLGENDAAKKYPELTAMIQDGEVERDKVKPDKQTVYDQLAILALENVDPEAENGAKVELAYLLGRLRSDQKEKIKEEFARKIRAAEERGDREGLKALMVEFSSLIK